MCVCIQGTGMWNLGSSGKKIGNQLLGIRLNLEGNKVSISRSAESRGPMIYSSKISQLEELQFKEELKMEV